MEKSFDFLGRIVIFFPDFYSFFSYFMPASSLESVMKILQKHQNKVIPLSLFEQRLQSVFGEDLPKGKIYKLTHQLKNK